MARTTVNVTGMALNGGTAGTATAIDTTNNMVLVTTDGKLSRHFLQITNTGGTAGTMSVEPGIYPPAFQQGLGTQTVVVAAGGTAFVTLESARFVQADGLSVYLDFAPAAWVGAIYAFELPTGL